MDERTIEILKRFKVSWTATTDFYDRLINKYPGWEKLRPVQNFIKTLEDRGDDNYFRLGTSIDHLLISRSVEHGLRTDQKFIAVEAIGLNDFQVTLRDGEKIYRQYRLNSLNDVRLEALLQTLKHTLVD